MENVIYYELRKRGFSVEVGNLTIVENGKDGKPVKRQLEVDFICNKGSFKKIVIISDAPRPFYSEEGILIINVYDFLLNSDSLEL